MKKTTTLIYLLISFFILCLSRGFAQPDVPSSALVVVDFQDQSTKWKDRQGIELVQNTVLIAAGKQTAGIVSDDLIVPLTSVTPFLSLSVACTVQNADEHTIKIFIRAKNQTGEYSEWIQIHNDSHAADGESRAGLAHHDVIRGLVFLPKTTVVLQYKCEMRRSQEYHNPVLTGLYFSFFNPGDTPPDFSSTLAAQSIRKPQQTRGNITAISRPAFVTRTEWGCPTGQTAGAGQSDLASTEVTHLIVHHSYSPGNTVSDWPAAIRSVWKYHTDPKPAGQAWSDLGYNWLIDPNGIIYQGRAWINDNENTRGAHFCGTNPGTMGVCMLGNYSEIPAPEKAVQSLVKLLAYKASDRSIDPLGTSFFVSGNKTLFNISGHRDGCSTECPGNLLYPTLPEIRQRTADILRTATTIHNGQGLRSELTMYYTDQRGESELRYTLPEKGLVRFYCYDLVGRLLIAQEAVTRNAGQHVVALRSYSFPKAPVIWCLEYRQEGHSPRRLTKILPFIE